MWYFKLFIFVVINYFTTKRKDSRIIYQNNSYFKTCDLCNYLFFTVINYFTTKIKNPKIIYFHTITSGTSNYSLFTVINYFTTKIKNP